ncbi:FHA domain-containing protein, partial [Candidatus Deferrimicrobium sp.]|uniref:FHA domain-containing protein n=1 Tax=Candidatus Deferrimicrobium sp. TaxID=3060586 RepID=UPI00271E8071
MKRPPIIVVQLIHLSGPLKGQIQEFAEGSILVGRHPSCHVRFPADVTALSRTHAEIVRDGNQFRLVDKSTNGTFVNGKRITETFLKSGDVLAFAEGGPKVSFLTEVKEASAVVAASPVPPPPPVRQPARAPEVQRPEPPRVETPRPAPPAPREERAAPPPPPPVGKTKTSMIIQIGPTLRSFKELPVTIGTGTKCELVLPFPGIQEAQAQIFFAQGQYWVKDLTGLGVVKVGGRPVGTQVPLNLQDELSLGPRGPVFRFMGEGRFAEV